MGRGTVQENAISEVADLPANSPYKGNALDLFLSLKLELESKQSIEPEERDLAMRLSALYIEKIQEAQQVGEARGRQEGRTEGRTEEGQALILRQLTRRVGNVSIETETQVKALSLARLEELGEALLDFTQMGDLLAWLDGDWDEL
jgi:predicted transposase YdaD